MESALQPSDEILKLRKNSKNPADYELSGRAKTLFDALPNGVRPGELMSQYPHAANRLAIHWGRPFAAVREFGELLIDHRGTRQGFPMEVALELHALYDYYVSEISPQAANIWNDSNRSRFRR